MRLPVLFATLALFCLAAQSVQAETSAPVEDTTRFSLRALFRLLPLPLSEGSGCYQFAQPQSRPMTIGDMFADRLGDFDMGENRITATCDREPNRTCIVSLRHGVGEDLVAVDIRFRIVDGRISSNSVECVPAP